MTRISTRWVNKDGGVKKQSFELSTRHDLISSAKPKHNATHIWRMLFIRWNIDSVKFDNYLTNVTITVTHKRPSNLTNPTAHMLLGELTSARSLIHSCKLYMVLSDKFSPKNHHYRLTDAAERDAIKQTSPQRKTIKTKKSINSISYRFKTGELRGKLFMGCSGKWSSFGAHIHTPHIHVCVHTKIQTDWTTHSNHKAWCWR